MKPLRMGRDAMGYGMIRSCGGAAVAAGFAQFGLAWLALAAISALADVPPNLPLVAPEGAAWDAGDGFAFARKPKKTRRSVSGIACPPASDSSSRRNCLLAFDEGVEARFATIEAGRLVPLADRVILRSEDEELDGEGAALDGDWFYLTGSHSAKRSTCASNPGSRHVIRFRRDPATGEAARDASGKLLGHADSGTRLWDLMASLPDIAPYVGERRCLGTEAPEEAPELKGQRGVNIEGMSATKGRLTFGFRGPSSIDGRVPLLSVDAAGLFDGGPMNAKVNFIEVGKRRGIRDLQAIESGILVLAGPDDDAASVDVGWIVGLWDGGTTDGVGQPQWLAKLKLDGTVRNSCDEDIKPEAITVLEDNSNVLRILILSDGMCDGGPLSFRIRR
ncbi:DUF3616 domain-containing protein [Methylobacterium fujisawaense]